MANNPILPVQTLCVSVTQTSNPVRAPIGTEISVAITSGTCTVDYTYSSLAAVQAGTATWVVGGIGTYSASTTAAVKIWKDCWVRVACSAGTVCVTVDPQGQTVASASAPTGEPGASNLESMQAGFDSGTPTQQAAFQASVSGGFVCAKIYALTAATVPAATNYQHSFGLTEYAVGLTVSGNNIVVNASGYYLLIGVCRVADSTTSGKQFSIGVHTRTDDGVWNYWFSVGSAIRQTFSNARIAYYAAGDVLKMSSYSDQGLNVVDRSFTVLLLKAA